MMPARRVAAEPVAFDSRLCRPPGPMRTTPSDPNRVRRNSFETGILGRAAPPVKRKGSALRGHNVFDKGWFRIRIEVGNGPISRRIPTFFHVPSVEQRRPQV